MEYRNTYKITLKVLYSNSPRPKLVTLIKDGENGEEVTNFLTRKILNNWGNVEKVTPVSWVNLNDESDSYYQIYVYVIDFQIIYSNCKEPANFTQKSKAANGAEAARKLEAKIKAEWENISRFILLDWVNRDDWKDSLTTFKNNEQ